MSQQELHHIEDLVESAFHDSQVFVRQAGRHLLTHASTRDGGRGYVVLLAGPPNSTHRALRQHRSRQAALEDYPLRLREGGEAHVCMELRALAAGESSAATECAVPFVPGGGLPSIAVRTFHLRLFDLPDNPLGLHTLRIECDGGWRHRATQPDWLRDWQQLLGDHPAHPTWHMHINSGDPGNYVAERQEFTDDDLRLAIGTPNPLTLLLSFAAWYQGLVRLRHRRS